MDKRELQKLLSQPYKQDNWKEIVQFVFPNVSILSTPKEFPISNDKIRKFSQIGNVRLNDGKTLALFELLLADSVNLQRNRVELNNEISKYIDQEQIHGVLSVFEQGGDDYRFTFSAKSTEFDEEESDFVQRKTDTKRYTYVLGKNESCKTPADRFYALSENKDEADIQDIQQAFSVERLSKEFFERYKKQFDKFWNYIASDEELSKVFVANDQEKRELKIRDFTKKLLGRIVFLHFLQKKGWMGCPNQDSWGAGDKQFMYNLFNGYDDKEHFHSICLSELFYKTLNNRRKNDLFSLKGVSNSLNGTKIPYLNGGLFDSDQKESGKIDFPETYFEELLEFFSQYNFTIDENDPNDHEVGIDPEMLGHIFENLLEDNKDKGAFYTPKVIVQFMCQESLIEYLNTKLNSEEEGIAIAIKDLVRNKAAEKSSDLDLIEDIAQALFDVKVCDPAIGSGAFPMGLLMSIYQLIEELWMVQPDTVARVWNISDSDWQPHLVKKNIIQHSIYGVDIESGAVDIARLRFWLALVVDEEEPLPLPNLDYKIMQGNSLLENFEGIDLSQISNAAAYETVIENEQIDMFTGEAKKKTSISLNFEDIEALMNEYFNADEPDLKKELHRRIDEQVLNHIRYTLAQHKNELFEKSKGLENKIKSNEAAVGNWEQKEKIRTSSKEARALEKLRKELDKYSERENRLAKLSNSNERPFFLWHLFFGEIFQNGGFDIVIANPPYVEFKNLHKSDKNLLEPLYESLKGKYDLYVAFMELYHNISKQNGIVTSIHPTRFMQRDYGASIREFYAKKMTICSIVDFVDKQVFENALAYTGIFVFKKTNTKHQEFKYKKAKNNKIIRSINELYLDSELFELMHPKSSTLDSELWIFHSESTSKLFLKLKETSTPLSEVVDGIYQGIATGKDNVFVVDKATVDTLGLEMVFLKPFIKGKDIAPYSIEFKNKYLIYTYKSDGKPYSESEIMDLSPNIHKYLVSKKDDLKGRGYFDKSNKLWFELWNQRNPERFEQLKIVTLDNARRNSFALDEANSFGSTTVYNLIQEGASKEFYIELMLVLNSSLLNFYHKNNTVPQAGGYFRYQAIFINNLPVKMGLDSSLIEEFKTRLINGSIEDMLGKIDKAVFDLYGLTDDEIKLINMV